MQHIFIAEIDGKEIDMATMMPEEKQKAVMEMTRKFLTNGEVAKETMDIAGKAMMIFLKHMPL